jgi:PhzF family phenazine biosynthesis protein
MSIPIYQVDAFTERAFAGNPACVVMLNEQKEDEWMASLAAEMNLSETAFLLPREDGYHLRWFTPAAEVALCGHATLASAHILWEEGYLQENEPATFETLSGRLGAVKKGDWIEMDFPAFPAEETALSDELADMLGGNPQEAFTSSENLMAVYGSPEEVAALVPDFARVAQLRFQGVIVTAKGDGRPYDFVSRYFAPRVGVDEDPVTGSAHSSLCPFWARRLGKEEMMACQTSKRGGVLRVRDQGERVAIAGQAKTIFTGELLV